MKVHVMRNPLGDLRPDQPWLVRCDICGGGDFLGGLMGAGIKGYAKDWRIAQDYAIRHALAHEATRCPTCLHVPTELLASERTTA